MDQIDMYICVCVTEIVCVWYVCVCQKVTSEEVEDDGSGSDIYVCLYIYMYVCVCQKVTSEGAEDDESGSDIYRCLYTRIYPDVKIYL